MNWMQWTIILLLTVSIIEGAYYYDALPDQMATHWNESGEVNGYMEKPLAVFLLPLVMGIVIGGLYLIPRIDPLKENIKKFGGYYQGLILVLAFFLTYIQMLTIIWNLGIVFDMNKLITPAIGILFIYLGLLMGKSKQNWFVGIKTPWTLSNARVWEKTHLIGKKVFILLGILWIVIGVFASEKIGYLLGLLVLTTIGLILLSYLEYQKEIKAISSSKNKKKNTKTVKKKRKTKKRVKGKMKKK